MAARIPIKTTPNLLKGSPNKISILEIQFFKIPLTQMMNKT